MVDKTGFIASLAPSIVRQSIKHRYILYLIMYGMIVPDMTHIGLNRVLFCINHTSIASFMNKSNAYIVLL